VDLIIPKGKFTSIIGRSGGEKSVLLKHMIGLLKPDRGEVWVDGVEISQLRGTRLNQVRRRFAMLFQGAALFDSLTVLEDVAFPLRETLRLPEREVFRRAEQKLHEVALSGMGHKFPAELSRGMRKRVGLARALITEPEIILFDEPTTGLDPVTAKTIHDLIVAMHRALGFTAVMVSHDITEILAITDWVALLADGRIAAMAPAADLQEMRNPALREFLSAGGIGILPRLCAACGRGGLRCSEEGGTWSSGYSWSWGSSASPISPSSWASWSSSGARAIPSRRSSTRQQD
jgi:phospholipid/cholesterol/gamma-HCH transport system ATP-binding protein